MSAISIYYVPVSSRLQKLLLTLRRLLIFAAYNVPTALAGVMLFFSEIHYLGLNSLLMHSVNFPATTLMAYAVNRQVPAWKVRAKSHISGLGYWSGYSAVKWGISQLCFICCAGLLGLPAVATSIVLTLVMGTVSYFVNDRKVFPKSEEAV